MRLLLFATASAIATLAPLSAPALQIETRYYGPGQMIPSIGVAGDRPETAAGGGDLASIVRAAADAWESLIFDQHSLTLHFGWYPTTNVSNSAYHTAGAWGGSPLREVSGSLAFNNEPGGPRVFLDPTPYTAEEFSLTRRGFGQYGDAVLEDTRTFEAVTEEAIGRNDLYTAALHEIGHALGLTLGDAFLMETYDGDIDLLDTPYEGG